MDIERLRTLSAAGHSVREIAAEIGKSYTAVKYHLDKHGIRTRQSARRDQEKENGGVLICLKHGQSDHYRQKDGHRKCRECQVDANNRRRRRVKQMAVAYKGGVCEKCGYNRCLGALEFHHKNPSKKDFGVGAAVILSWKKTKAELDKCILLCANCHREEHDKLYLVSSAA